MNRKWLIAVLSWVILMINIMLYLSLIPDWVRWSVSILLGSVIFVVLVKWYISDETKKKLNLIKPILLHQLADIDYTDNFDKCNFCIDEKYPMYSDNVDSCLRRDVESLNKDIKMYNSQAEDFIDELNLKIAKLVKQKISIEWDATMSPPEPLRYYSKYIYSEIGDRVRFCNEKHYGKREYPLGLQKPNYKDGMGRWKLNLGSTTLVASDNEKEIDDIQKTITEIFNTVVSSAEFKRLNNFFEKIKDEHEIYKNEIKRVIRDLEKNVWSEE
jgi:hypothetical protein